MITRVFNFTTFHQVRIMVIQITSLTYDGHDNQNLCGDLSTLVVVCFLGIISIVTNLSYLDQDIG